MHFGLMAGMVVVVSPVFAGMIMVVGMVVRAMGMFMNVFVHMLMGMSVGVFVRVRLTPVSMLMDMFVGVVVSVQMPVFVLSFHRLLLAPPDRFRARPRALRTEMKAEDKLPGILLYSYEIISPATPPVKHGEQHKHRRKSRFRAWFIDHVFEVTPGRTVSPNDGKSSQALPQTLETHGL